VPPPEFWNVRDELAVFEVGLFLKAKFAVEDFEFRITGNRAYLPLHIAALTVTAIQVEGNAVVWWHIKGERLAFGFRKDPPPIVKLKYKLQVRWLPFCCHCEDYFLAMIAKQFVAGITTQRPYFINLSTEETENIQLKAQNRRGPIGQMVHSTGQVIETAGAQVDKGLLAVFTQVGNLGDKAKPLDYSKERNLEVHEGLETSWWPLNSAGNSYAKEWDYDENDDEPGAKSQETVERKCHAC